MSASVSRILLAVFLGTAAAQACTGNRGPCPLGDDHVFTNDSSNESLTVVSNCRAECVDYGDGCCAPEHEARVCKLPGYRVEPSWERRSEWCVGITVGMWQSALYQCCTDEEHSSGDSTDSTGAIGSVKGGVIIGCFALPCILWLSGAFVPRWPSPLRPSKGQGRCSFGSLSLPSETETDGRSMRMTFGHGVPSTDGFGQLGHCLRMSEVCCSHPAHTSMHVPVSMDVCAQACIWL